jgi:translation initiation factor IF-2
MNYDYKKRDCLLPDGCKDIIDALKLQAKETPAPPQPLPPIIGKVSIADPITVHELAALLKQKPFQIIAQLIGLDVFATAAQEIDFEAASKVARKYGYKARRAIIPK